MQFDFENKKLVLGIGTVAAAFGIGVVMQSVESTPALDAQIKSPEPFTVEDITLTASTGTRPAMLSTLMPAPTIKAPERLMPPADTDGNLVLPVAATPDVLAPGTGAAPADNVASACAIEMTATPGMAATVTLDLNAACLPEERFVVHHNGMMFSAMTDDAGQANLVVPALAERSVFIVSFDNGDGAVQQADVPDIGSYSRVVAQWRGEAGLGLHAREYEAEYFAPGHVHAAQSGSLDDADQGKSGVLQRFGAGSGPEPLMAEIYSYPVALARDAGTIALSLEAEITEANCDAEVDAQTLEIGPDSPLRVRDLTLYMPQCDAVGDFLVLKNLVGDMTLAAK